MCGMETGETHRVSASQRLCVKSEHCHQGNPAKGIFSHKRCLAKRRDAEDRRRREKDGCAGWKQGKPTASLRLSDSAFNRSTVIRVIQLKVFSVISAV